VRRPGRPRQRLPMGSVYAAAGRRSPGPAGIALGILEAVPPGQVRSKMSIFERRLREKVAPPRPVHPCESPSGAARSAGARVVRLGSRRADLRPPVRRRQRPNGPRSTSLARCPVRPSRIPRPPPRPSGPSGYEVAARASMTGRHRLMQVTLTKMLADYHITQQTADR
jgi:hypothetical protein